MNNTPCDCEYCKRKRNPNRYRIYKIVIGILLLGLAGFLLIVTSPPVSADESVLHNGTFYFRNITPQNDIYETVVHPGDTIVLGRTYDLTYVYGVTGQFAWWKNDNNAGMTCTPDLVINTSYIATNGRINPKSVYLDSTIWKTGDYYQWEGCYQLRYVKGNTAPQYSPYIADNNLMFHVIYDPHPSTPHPTPTFPPTITATPTPTKTPLPVTLAPDPTTPKKQEKFPVWWLIGGIFGVILIGLWFWED